MGVSGSGKSPLAEALAQRLDRRLLDADDLHPPANRARLAAGVPLTDADRAPWLDAVAAWIEGERAAGNAVVVACSALKRSYRERLRRTAPDEVLFVHLDLDHDTLMQRMRARRGHFMPPSQLADQLATLEPPAADERAVVVAPLGPVQDLVGRVLETAGD
uniref:Gluconokinase n=1 Tax=Coralloluteibacterium stylophorae TaxID=1776034 RepID=A0A8J7VUM0_9GAMM